MDLSGKRILLGVTGSIAAYRAADICSALTKAGATVHVALTRHASQFISPTVFRALSRHPVAVGLFDEPVSERIAHIDLAHEADLVLVAPATANILGKLAHGIADDFLSTSLLAVPPHVPLLAAPAMNTSMWEHPAVRANVELLRARGVQFIEPAEGVLACGDEGRGKLADVEAILEAVRLRLELPGPAAGSLAGKMVLVTAGATREPLDPVRFLTNRSSGKMGCAIAAEAARRGARVVLVCGALTVAEPRGVIVVHAETADAMLSACSEYFQSADIFIAAAAVADYAPVTVSDQKLKKQDNAPDGTITLQLRPTPDILATLAAQKRGNQFVVGFAAETHNLHEFATRKMVDKHLDLIVANDVTRPGAGFDVDTNEVSLLWPDGRIEELALMSKLDVAAQLLNRVTSALDNREAIIC